MALRPQHWTLSRRGFFILSGVEYVKKSAWHNSCLQPIVLNLFHNGLIIRPLSFGERALWPELHTTCRLAFLANVGQARKNLPGYTLAYFASPVTNNGFFNIDTSWCNSSERLPLSKQTWTGLIKSFRYQKSSTTPMGQDKSVPVHSVTFRDFLWGIFSYKPRQV